jgi:hypothetical protein
MAVVLGRKEGYEPRTTLAIHNIFIWEGNVAMTATIAINGATQQQQNCSSRSNFSRVSDSP